MDEPSTRDEAPKEPFYEHCGPSYPCPSCERGFLELVEGTLHFGETADSRDLWEHVGREIGEGDWRFACLFKCKHPDCQETVACTGMMAWATHPPLRGTPMSSWQPGHGQMPTIAESEQRMRDRLVREFRPTHFLPPFVARNEALFAAGTDAEAEAVLKGRMSERSADEAVGVYRQVLGYRDDWIPSSVLGQLGLSSKTVHAWTPSARKGTDYKPADSGALQYQRDWLLVRIRDHWTPQAKKSA